MRVSSGANVSLVFMNCFIVGCLAACAGSNPLPPKHPDNPPISVEPEPTTSGEFHTEIFDAVPADSSAVLWTTHDRDDLALRFQLPSSWVVVGDQEGLLFANPQPPNDDASIIFMRIDDKSGVAAALKRLDGAFPLSEVKYNRQQVKDELNGIQVELGEGTGKSRDFDDAQLYFLLVLMDLDDHYVLKAAYIQESAFAQRSAVFGQILKSIERTNR